MEQLVLHWTDFHEILYTCIFRKSVEKIRVSLDCFTLLEDLIPIFNHIRSVFLRMKNVADKSCRGKHAYFFSETPPPPPPENRAFF
jgi:hypothetical protein